MSKNLTMIEINEFELDTLYTERDLYFSQVNALEAKNGELEKKLAFSFKKRVELEEKLEVASKVLKKCENILDTPLVISPNKDTHKEIKQALAAINGGGV